MPNELATRKEAIEWLKRIAEIIEAVDQRCMAADGPVTPTLQEMTQAEISEIYKLASETVALTERGRNSTKAPAPEQSRGADDLKALREKVEVASKDPHELSGFKETFFNMQDLRLVQITLSHVLSEIDALAAKQSKRDEGNR